MGVYFLEVEEDAGEWGGEVEGGVGYVVGCCDEGVCEGGWGEVWGEESFVVDVGWVGVCHCWSSRIQIRYSIGGGGAATVMILCHAPIRHWTAEM